jgi:large subunit ribosomal protein L25
VADELRIAAETRTEFGKGAARRIRRDNKVPAVLYGHGTDPVHLSLPGHDLMMALKNSNALLTLALPKGEELALPKAVQRDPIKGFIEHVDLILVRRGEKVTVEVPVHVVGEPPADSLINQELTTLEVEAEATHIPNEFEVSIEGLSIGDTVPASQVVLPAGSTLVTDPEHVVVGILAAPTAEQLDAEATEAEAEAGVERDEAEAAEGDGGSDESSDES